MYNFNKYYIFLLKLYMSGISSEDYSPSTSDLDTRTIVRFLWKKFNQSVDMRPDQPLGNEFKLFDNTVLINNVLNKEIPKKIEISNTGNFLLNLNNISDDQLNRSISITGSDILDSNLNVVTLNTIHYKIVSNYPDLENIYLNLDILGEKYKYLRYYHKLELRPIYGQNFVGSWSQTDPISNNYIGSANRPENTNLMLRNTIPDNFDSKFDTYKYKLRRSRPSDYVEEDKFRSPFYYILDSKNGFIVFLGDMNEAADAVGNLNDDLQIITTSTDIHFSFIKYIGPTGFDDAELSGNIVVDGSLNINGDLNISGGNIFIDRKQVNFSGNVNGVSDWDDLSLSNLDLSGNLRFKVSDTSYITLIAPQELSSSYTLKLPISQGASGQILSIDDSGQLIFKSIELNSSGKDKFFFFFLSKPYPPVYLDGCYNYPIANYDFMNKDVYYFSYGNDSSLNRLDISSSQNLQLYFKIPPRRFINWNYNHEDECSQNYIPDYNNLVIEYRSRNIDSISFSDWNELVNFSLPDPSNSSGIQGTYTNDLSMNFIFHIDKGTGSDDITITQNIVDNSFNIIYTYGTNSNIIQTSKAYQFRIYITNYSEYNISKIPGIMPDYSYNQYNQSINDLEWNYLYFPSDITNYYQTLSRGNPKPPTHLDFQNENGNANNFNNVNITGSLNFDNADDQNVVSFPIQADDNSIIFTLDLSGHKSSTYKKAIPYTADNLLIDFSNGPISVKNFDKTISTSMYNLQPEYVYDVSNYGIYFKDDPTNIAYVEKISTITTIDKSVTISHPLRYQVNSNYDKLINNSSINIFQSNLSQYNSNIDYQEVIWRDDNSSQSFNFFRDTKSTFNILNTTSINLYNGKNTSSINTANEIRGTDLSGENLSKFILSTFRNTTLKHSSTEFQTTGTFRKTFHNESDISFSLTLNTMDISESTNSYTRTNGYYIGTTITGISYAIDLNNFFDIPTDLKYNNIKFKPQISQIFPSAPPTPFNNSKEYPIYKITNDLTQSFVIETPNITISQYGTSLIANTLETYFGLTSKQPNDEYELKANGSIYISGLSKYIRSTTDSLGSLTITINGINGAYSPNSKTISSYSWPSSGTENELLSILQTFKPFSNSTFTVDYGRYEGNFQYQAVLTGTLYNNVFTPGGSKSINPIITSSNYDTNLTTKYFWDTTRINTPEYTMIRCKSGTENEPFSNDSNDSFNNFEIYTVSDEINERQALFQNNKLYGGKDTSVYKTYTSYDENSSINYFSFNTTGDNPNYTISSFFSNFSSKIIDANYKWIAFEKNLNPAPTTSNMQLSFNSDSIHKNHLINLNIIIYIKLKYGSEGIVINNNTYKYSKWLDCLASGSGLAIDRIVNSKAGCYTGIANIYPLNLILPEFPNCSELYLLIGIKDSFNFNVSNNFINITIN